MYTTKNNARTRIQECKIFCFLNYFYFRNAIQCDQSLAKVAYTVKDPYEADPSNPLVRIVSNLKWPQVDGKLLKNVYPPYVSIHGGIRQLGLCYFEIH